MWRKERVNYKDFYYWMQRELEKELLKIYKKVHRVAVLDDMFYIWFLNNEDCVFIPLDVMENIYNNGKSMEELSAIIDAKYIARIKR